MRAFRTTPETSTMSRSRWAGRWRAQRRGIRLGHRRGSGAVFWKRVRDRPHGPEHPRDAPGRCSIFSRQSGAEVHLTSSGVDVRGFPSVAALQAGVRDLDAVHRDKQCADAAAQSAFVCACRHTRPAYDASRNLFTALRDLTGWFAGGAIFWQPGLTRIVSPPIFGS